MTHYMRNIGRMSFRQLRTWAEREMPLRMWPGLFIERKAGVWLCTEGSP